MPARAEQCHVLRSERPDEFETSTATHFSSTTQVSTGLTQAPDRQSERAGSVLFRSILFAESETEIEHDSQNVAELFSDLNLDQVVESVIAGRDEYDLKPFFWTPLTTVDAVNYRYDVLRDLENPTLAESIQTFAQEMRRMRDCLRQADKLYYKYQRQRWFLDAVDIYCAAVKRLNQNLTHTALDSYGFRSLRGFLASYIESNDFVLLFADTKKLISDLEGISYLLHITGRQVAVSKYDSAPDYSANVLQTFQKFSQGAAKEYRFEVHAGPEMNHVEAAILDIVAKLYPEIFSFQEEYCSRYKEYLNSVIARFDREVQFYLANLEHFQRLERAGLQFCYPVVSDQSKKVSGKSVFDLALANKLIPEKEPVITNDFYLTGQERIMVVSGPNQGGKTTFARMFGQLHYLASIGCPVPGSEAKLFLADRLFTHFEKEEDIHNLRGKLEDELIRIHHILDCATSNSILIMNESFLSTTLNDALFLSKKIMQQIVALDMLCVSVTFLDELASFSETTVSMVSTVHPKKPTLRTFKVVRRPADGLAYAIAIAEKYRLTHDAVKARIAGRRA